MLERCSASIAAYLRRKEDSADDVRTKLGFLLCQGFGGLILSQVPFNDKASGWDMICGIAGCVISLGLTADLLIRRRLSRPQLYFGVGQLAVFIAAFDLSLSTIYFRQWPLFVLLVDFLLVARAPRSASLALVGFIVCWLLLMDFDLTFKFGLMDSEFIRSYHRRRAATVCEKPPCARGAAQLPALAINSIATFIIDYMLTRGFAEQMEAEREKLRQAVTVSQGIAQSLASFDLDAAREAIEAHGATLPEELTDAYETLVANLGSYRPYLPQAFFVHDAHQSSVAALSPRFRDMSIMDFSFEGTPVPGVSNGKAAIVFTDIKQSTALWEHSHPDTMADALDKHNTVVRDAIDTHCGYEVKTIGDAFMVAFATAEDAVNFGMQVQVELGRISDDNLWPTGLSRGAADAFDLLSVRIGVHYDRVRVEKNVLTGRFDYFGRATNKAARVEANGLPNCVVVTDCIVKALDVRFFEDVLEAIVVPYGEPRMGKGLTEPLWLTACLPTSLSRCEARVREECAGKTEVAVVSLAQVSRGASAATTGSRADTTMGTAAGTVVDMGTPSAPCEPPPHRPRGDSGAYGVVTSPDAPSRASVMGTPPPRDVLLVRTVRSAATVAAVKYHFWDGDTYWDAVESRTTHALAHLHACLLETQGHLSAVVNTVVVASWNTHRKCPQHINFATRFLIRMHESYGAGVGACGGGRVSGEGGSVATVVLHPNQHHLRFHAGLSTGAVATGQLAASPSQRFVTLLGPCPELALSLCAGAAEVGAAALVGWPKADSGAERYDTDFLAPHLKMLDVWQMAGAERQLERSVLSHMSHEMRDGAVVVYELNLATLAGEMGEDGSIRRARARSNNLRTESGLVPRTSTTHRRRLQYALAAVRKVDRSQTDHMMSSADDADDLVSLGVHSVSTASRETEDIVVPPADTPVLLHPPATPDLLAHTFD